jgi:hypothetical protein
MVGIKKDNDSKMLEYSKFYERNYYKYDDIQVDPLLMVGPFAGFFHNMNALENRK